jgi:hypothetical protein
MQMNEVHRPASGWVQRPPPNVAAEITERGHPTVALAIPLKEDTSMLKTVSVLAAPAFAATSGQTAPVVKAAAAKTRTLNAHARMDRHHVSYHRHHRHHHKMAALGKHHISKVAVKHTAAARRG